MLLPPLTEGCGIDLDDCTLDQGLGTNQFIITGIIDNVDDPGLSSNCFRSPCKITRVKTESTLLDISTTYTNFVDAFGTNTGVGCLTTKLILSLFAIVSTLGSCMRTFVTTITTDAYLI